MNTYRVVWRQEFEGYIDNGKYRPAYKDVKADRMEIHEGVKFFRGKTAFMFFPMESIFYVELIEEGEQSEPVIPADSPEHSKPPRIVSPLSEELQSKADAIDAGGEGD